MSNVELTPWIFIGYTVVMITFGIGIAYSFIKITKKDKKKSSDDEKCIICGNNTSYKTSDNINVRNWYVEGGGQLCRECYEKVYKDKAMQK